MYTLTPVAVGHVPRTCRTQLLRDTITGAVNMKSKLVVIAIAVSIPPCVFSSDVYLSLTRKAVTPSGYEQEIEKLPVSVSVVTKDDIKMSNAKQATEILGGLPGVFIKKTGDFGRADVDIRGIGGNGRQLGIFIDGRPD